MSSMSGEGTNNIKSGPFAHDAKEQAALDYVIANFDKLAVHPESASEHASSNLNVAFVKAGTKLTLNGETIRLQLNVYRFNNADGTHRYAVDVKELLGAGGNSKVYKWIDAETGEALAAKAIKNPKMLKYTLEESERFNNIYKKLHGGKYKDSGKVFFTANPKKQIYDDGEDDRKWPDSLVFVMPKFPGDTIDTINKIAKNKATENIAKKMLPSLITPPVTKRGLAARGYEEADNDLPDGPIIGLETMFGAQDKKTLEEEFESRLAEVEEEIKSGRLDFPGDMRRVDIPEHTEKFRTILTTKEQLDKEVKNNLERFIMRPSEVLPDMTPHTNVDTDAKGKRLQRIDQINFEDNFEFLLLVFKNMIHAVSVAHELGMFVNDVKPENFNCDDEGNVYIFDLGEAVDKDNTDPSIAKEFVLRCTVPYATPKNLLALMNNRLHYPEAEKARKLLALKALYKEKGLEAPKELQDLDQNELERTAKAWKYTYNAESDAYALGCCGELMCGLLIPAMEAVYTPTAGFGMPASIFTTADDPSAAKINQFLKITKGLRGQGEPQMSLEQATAAIDSIKNKPAAASEETHVKNKESQATKRKKSLVDEGQSLKRKASAVTYDDKVIEYIISKENNEEPENSSPDIKVETKSEENKSVDSFKSLDPDAISDIEKCFNDIDVKEAKERQAKENDAIETVTPLDTAKIRKLKVGKFPHLSRLFKPEKSIDKSPVDESTVDKSLIYKKTFVPKGTMPDGGIRGIPCDCYRLPNGVIIAQTTTTLGAGTNGVVYEGVDIKSGVLYAIKIPKIDDQSDDKDNVENKNNNVAKKNIDRNELIEWSNKKIKLGNKLMAAADIARNPQHEGMYDTMNLGGIEIAFMPKLDGEQLDKLIKNHVDPLFDALDMEKEMAPAIDKPARRPSECSFVMVEEAKNTKLDALVIKANQAEQLYSIAYYREKRRNESDRFIKGHLSRIKDYLGRKGAEFLSIEKEVKKQKNEKQKEDQKENGEEQNEQQKEKVTMIADKVKSYLPDNIIYNAMTEYAKHREEKVVIEEPEVFIKKLSQIIKDCMDVCKDNATLLRQGATNRDIKPENMIRTRLGLATIDYDEAEEFKYASNVIFGKEHIARGSTYYLSPYNKEVYYHLKSNAAAINAASEALGIYEILSQQGKLTEDLTEPGGLFSEENLALLKILADPPDYVWNAQSEANAIGTSAEELSQICFNKLLLKKHENGMPNKLISDTADPCVAVFNKFLEITKNLKNPDVNNVYVASQAAEDFALLEKRIEALQDVREQLKHPRQELMHTQPSITGRITSTVQPYLNIGATVKTAIDMTRQNPAWDNVIQTLAVELDPTKHKVEVKADKSVVIKDTTTKSVGSLALTEGNVCGTTSDADAFEQMLKVYIASHKPGEAVEITIVGLADDPQQAIRFADIAKKLDVDFSFDEETRKAVDRHSPDNKYSKYKK